MSDWFDDAGRGSPCDVGAMFDSKLPVLLGEIAAQGALVSFGTTSDGGALGITVTLDGRWRREYFRESEAACDWAAEALVAVQSAGGRSIPSSGPRKRSRRP